MADMTTEEIMKAAKDLYKSAQTTASISGARQAAMKAASLVFYLAKVVAKNEDAVAAKKAMALDPDGLMPSHPDEYLLRDD